MLKTREYEILSRDMDFLYDRQTNETGVSQESLQDVIRSHGNRDNFEYVTATRDGFIEVLFCPCMYEDVYAVSYHVLVSLSWR